MKANLTITSVLVVLSILVINSTDAAKILSVFPFPAKSHNIFIRAITDQLAARGHELTVYTSIPSGKNVTNVKEIPLNNTLYKFIEKFNFNFIRQMDRFPIFSIPVFLFMSLAISSGGFDDPIIAELIKSDEKFDLVLLETGFGQEAFIAFGYKFQAPVVSMHTLATNFGVDEYVGNPSGLAYIPTLELPSYSEHMTFFQRAHNVLRSIIYTVFTYVYYLPKQDSIMRAHFKFPGSEKIPPIIDMLQNVSLVVTNIQPVIDIPRPWVPNVIAAGGAHISQKRIPLPQDLKAFMDSSNDGVIYISFGTVVPIEQMPDDMRRSFLNAFGKLKQNVLWKLSNESLPDLPKNVKISKWLPQQEILAHRNCLAFMTHGGLLSHEEALYFGVPLIGVPFFGDQYTNSNRAVKRGYGVYLDQFNITEESVFWAINEVINGPKYRENAKRYSEIFRDTPLPPAENAAYWIEYVLKHKGAPHLKSLARQLPYYKLLLLDVITFMLLVIGFCSFVGYKVIRFICLKTVCKKSQSSKVTSSKKKN